MLDALLGQREPACSGTVRGTAPFAFDLCLFRQNGIASADPFADSIAPPLRFYIEISIAVDTHPLAIPLVKG